MTISALFTAAAIELENEYFANLQASVPAPVKDPQVTVTYVPHTSQHYDYLFSRSASGKTIRLQSADSVGEVTISSRRKWSDAAVIEAWAKDCGFDSVADAIGDLDEDHTIVVRNINPDYVRPLEARNERAVPFGPGQGADWHQLKTENPNLAAWYVRSVVANERTRRYKRAPQWFVDICLAEQAANEANATGEVLGQEGERINISGTITRLTKKQSEWGEDHFAYIETEQGTAYIKCNHLSLEEHREVTLRGTVVGSWLSRDGRMITKMNRAKMA